MRVRRSAMLGVGLMAAAIAASWYAAGLPNHVAAQAVFPVVPVQADPRLGIAGREAPPLGVRQWFNLPEGQETTDVTDYHGKVIYLYGFQSWCPGCHRHGFPTIQKLIEHYEDNQEVVFIAVQTAFEGHATNTPDAAKRTADKYGLKIPVGHTGAPGERSTMMQRYRTGGTPWTILIDRRGVVRFNDFHIPPEAGVKVIDQLLAEPQGPSPQRP